MGLINGPLSELMKKIIVSKGVDFVPGDQDRSEIFYDGYLIGFAWASSSPLNPVPKVTIRAITNITREFELNVPGVEKMQKFIGNMVVACRLSSSEWDMKNKTRSKPDAQNTSNFGKSGRVIEI